MEKTVVAHRRCLAEPEVLQPVTQADETLAASESIDDQPTAPAGTIADGGALAVQDGLLDVCGRPRRLVTRHTENFEAVQTLRAQGVSIRGIALRLDLDRKTVRRHIDADSLDELLFKATNRVSILDPFKPYLDHRAGHGCTNAVVLLAELQALGYTGSDQTVRRYLAPIRPKGARPKNTAPKPSAPAGRPAPPKPRQVTGWIMTNPANLKEGKAVQLKQVLARCPELDALTKHVAAFADMICNLRGDQLGTWMTAAAADNLPALNSLLIGMRRDRDAIHNGLTLPYSSGVVEGNVNRIKMLKRQSYGRASFPLLRKRILFAN